MTHITNRKYYNYRKAFERLGFTVAAEFLYEDYEVKFEFTLNVFNVADNVWTLKLL